MLNSKADLIYEQSEVLLWFIADNTVLHSVVSCDNADIIYLVKFSFLFIFLFVCYRLCFGE